MKKEKLLSKKDPRLIHLRRKIDQADLSLFSALADRFAAVRKVGVIKRTHGIPALQKGRWNEVMRERLRIARKQGLDPAFSRKLLKLIHGEALRIQRKKKS